MNPGEDPSERISEIMDHAGLAGGTMLQGKMPMSVIVMKVRAKLLAELKKYIEDRDVEIYQKGIREGRK